MTSVKARLPPRRSREGASAYYDGPVSTTDVPPGGHPGADPTGWLRAILDEHIAVAERTREQLLAGIADLAAELGDSLGRGGKLVAFGNGGSAADAQHFAAELVGHFRRTRPGLPAIALTANTSTLTAVANDYAYADVFARQAEALCGPADLVVGISTTGRADSVVRGILAGRSRGARTWALTGGGGGRLAEVADRRLVVPSDETARIQEMHITIIHAVSDLVDARFAGRG
jgi:D-sedoheptulose 7-phosphate isomerase